MISHWATADLGPYHMGRWPEDSELDVLMAMEGKHTESPADLKFDLKSDLWLEERPTTKGGKRQTEAWPLQRLSH